jgi:heterodisulfide reductase subunit A-like polyferredoxin
MSEVERRQNIVLLTNSEVLAVSGGPGNFDVKILTSPRGVDPKKCLKCGRCGNECPSETPNEFEENLSVLWRKKPVENLEEGGLSRTIRTDHTDELSLSYLKGDVLQHPVLMIPEENGIYLDHKILTTFLVLNR